MQTTRLPGSGFFTIFAAFLVLLLSALFGAGAASAQTSPVAQSLASVAPPPAAPWSADLAAFDAFDRQHPQPPGGVLFMGSSSIRLWDGLEAQFAELPIVIKRGLSGSRIDDCTRLLTRLVQRYQPRLVLFYAGDNDIAQGRTPTDVLASFKTFVARVRQTLADTRIAYISIKPSPRRSEFIGRIEQANALIRTFVGTESRLSYIDVFTPMLDRAGQPRAELFRDDGLHLNHAGYALWKSVIASRIDR